MSYTIIGKIKDEWTISALGSLRARPTRHKIIFLTNPTTQIFFTLPAKILFYKIIWATSQKPINYIAAALLKVFSRLTKAVVASTQVSESNYLKLGINSKKIILLYPPNENYSPSASRQNELVIGADSSISLEDGLGSLLKAVALSQDILGNVRLVIAGQTDEKNKIEWLAENLRIKERLQVFPARDAAWVKRIDIYVLPAAGGRLPLSLQSALVYGKAIVAADSQMAREFITPNKNGLLLEPAGGEMISQALINLGRNADWLGKMRENNLALAKKIFAQERFEELVKKIFA